LIDVDESHFGRTIKKIKNEPDKILGFNITVPYKEKIIPFVDDLDELAREIGAVNTVKILSNGRFQGFNTDVDGITASLAELGLSSHKISKRNVIILGAGGAARACAYTLAANNIGVVTFSNRTLSRAKSLAAHFQERYPNTIFQVRGSNMKELNESLQDCDILINAISRSSPKYFPLRLNYSKAKREMKVLDLGYKVPPSLFFQEANDEGLKVADGLSMLVEQAARSFEIWTSLKAPRKEMLLTAKAAREKI